LSPVALWLFGFALADDLLGSWAAGLFAKPPHAPRLCELKCSGPANQATPPSAAPHRRLPAAPKINLSDRVLHLVEQSTIYAGEFQQR